MCLAVFTVRLGDHVPLFCTFRTVLGLIDVPLRRLGHFDPMHQLSFPSMRFRRVGLLDPMQQDQFLGPPEC